MASFLALPVVVRAQQPSGHPGPMPSQVPPKPAAASIDSGSENEIDVNLWSAAIGSVDVSALLIGQNVYLQPADVFNFAHIRADASADGTKLSGYFIDPEKKYEFDNTKRWCTYQQHIYSLAADEYIVTSDGAYLRADMFEKIFNLKCIFDFRALSVELKSGEPLPAESEAKEAANRKKDLVGMSAGDENPDVTFPLQRSLFGIGTLDYLGSYSYTTGQLPSQAPASYEIYGGGEFLGGDMDATLEGQSHERVNWQEMPWQWRYSVQNSDLVRQVLIGRQDPLFTTMSLPDSMVGFQVSNVSTAYRKSFTNYTISDHTNPDWTVELYVNDALVNYTKADQTGYYKFVIPLSYGATSIKLKFYGPYGEVRTQVEDLRIPYTFLPPGHLEYTLTGGTSDSHPGLANSVGQLDMKVGVSTAMTVGGGMRFLGSPSLAGGAGISAGGANYTPYGTASVRITGDLLLGGEYYDGSGYRGTLNFTGPAGLSLEAEYDKPLSSASTSSLLGTSIVTNPFYIQDQRKLALSSPLLFNIGSLRMTATDLPTNTDTGNLTLSPEMLIDAFGTSINLSADGNFMRNGLSLTPMGHVTGQAGLSLMLFSGIVCRPDFNLDYSSRSVSSLQVGLTKSIGNWMNLSLMAARSFAPGGGNTFLLSLQSILPEMQVGLSSGSGTAQPLTSSATVQGSLSYDALTGFFGSNRPEVRRGGIEVVPFIDKNGDGKWDDGEPLVPKFGFERSPGQVISSDSGILRITDLEPYNHYFVQTSTANLDNISLMPKFSSFEVTPPANGFARIEIPLASAGQLEGYVMETKNGKQDALGGARMIVRHWEPGIDTSELSFSQDLLSYSNGEYYYMGIMPGKYRIAVDPKQLALLHATTKPAYIDFTVKSVDDGDVEEGLNFTIEPQPRMPVSPAEALKSK
ncbi:MAG TPA: hypothetical protein VFH95_02920 [Candidatus Kapabacteria bacterium]|nr:hypothetical protein [Candidatus Kapabacteria bacterium]